MIRRDFVTIGERQVHFRWAGSGPPVFALHQSPRDSEEMLPVIEALADRFTVIAPDTPGYGLSGPVAAADGDPDMDAFAQALLSLMDALGIRRAGFYGTHTGAIIATRFAARFPDRVAALVANGVLLLSSADRAAMLAQYLTPLAPAWDGGHLAWIWNRLRDQSIFYPWYERDPARRIHWPASLDQLQEAALDLLEAGDGYRPAYRAAIGYPIEEDLPRLKVPTCILFAGSDALSQYAAALPPLPSCAELRSIDDFDAAPAIAKAFIAPHLAGAPAFAAPSPQAGLAHRALSRMVAVGGGQAHVRACASGTGRPLVLLHDLGDSSTVLAPVVDGLVGARPVIAPDLPGHGESLPLGAAPRLEAASQLVIETLEALGLGEIDLATFGAAEAVGARIAALRPALVRRLVACNGHPPPPGGVDARRLVPDLSPEISGAHLHRAWIYVRDRDLYWPWFDPMGGQHLAAATPARVHALADRLLACLKASACHADLLVQALREPPAAAVNARLATEGHPSLGPWPQSGRLPADPMGWAARIEAQLA